MDNLPKSKESSVLKIKRMKMNYEKIVEENFFLAKMRKNFLFEKIFLYFSLVHTNQEKRWFGLIGTWLLFDY